jgi:hypothetical protein
MAASSDALASFAGPAGVGALCLLGIFLLFDGFAPALFPTFEQYAKTSSWGVVAAVPVLAISYVIGLSLMTGAERSLTAIAGLTTTAEALDLARLASGSSKDSAVSIAYLEHGRNRTVLGGGALALLVVGLGAISEIRNLPHLRGVIVLAALGVSILAFAGFYLAAQEGHAAHRLAQALGSQQTNVETDTVR